MDSNYLLENGRIAIKRMRHGLMLFNRNDNVIGRSLDHYGEWCEDELRLMGQAIRPGDLVLDVGANIGTHTLGFASMVGPSGHVFAFEPQPLVFNILCANVALNAADHVRCLNKAAGTSGGTIAVPYTPTDQPANFGQLSLRNALPGGSAKDRVEVIAVDDLELPACRLIKADVQGMEAEVLRSAARTIAVHRPILYVECEEVASAAELIGTIEDLDYTMWWHAVPYFSTSNFYDNPTNVFLHARPATNLLCLPSEAPRSVLEFEPCEGVTDDPQQALARIRRRLIKEAERG